MLVLVWGLDADRPTAAVLQQLRRMRVPVKFVDQRDVLETEVELEAGSQLTGWVSICGERFALDDVTAVYLRPYESSRLPFIVDAGAESTAVRHASQVDDILTSWSDLTQAFVVNRSAAMAANGSKPYQLQQIRDLGWSVPETLITTDPDAAQAFWEQHGEVVYKSVSSVRSRVSRLRSEHRERLSNISFCPTQFQRFIPGTDHRVHVVGDEVFACEVRSGADDYRYAGENPTA